MKFIGQAEKTFLLRPLESFVENPQVIVSTREIKNEAEIPQAWIDLLKKQEETQKPQFPAGWFNFSGVLPNVVNYLMSQHFGVALLLENQKLKSLLYARFDGKRVSYYHGRPPVSASLPENLATVFALFPEELRNFYLNLHNGWGTFDIPFDSLGPLPIEKVQPLSAETDVRLEKSHFDLTRIYKVFGNGWGDFVCLDTKQPQKSQKSFGLLWRHDKPHEFREDVNIWTQLQDWQKSDFPTIRQSSFRNFA